MRTIATTDTNDFALYQDGSMYFLSGLEAVAQESRHFAATLRGEKIYEQQTGVPYYALALGNNYAPDQLEHEIRKAILRAPNVREITSFTLTKVADVVRYEATIRGDEGSTLIYGTV